MKVNNNINKTITYYFDLIILPVSAFFSTFGAFGFLGGVYEIFKNSNFNLSTEFFFFFICFINLIIFIVNKKNRLLYIISPAIIFYFGILIYKSIPYFHP